MAIGDDFSVDLAGDIRHVSGATHYETIELHRWLQGLADNPSVAGGSNDVLDITSPTPSERSTDNIIKLLGNFNIDDDAAEYFYNGSIRMGAGATEKVYYAVKILGSVNLNTTQLQVIQDNALYAGDAPFWGDQSTGGYNGDALAGILAQFLVKGREFGCDIDAKRLVIQCRKYFDSYDFFNVELADGVSVAAVSSVDDPQNDTTQATVTAYTHVTNTEGYQQIDIGDGNGDQPYYSKWTFGVDTSGDQLKGVWEFIKDLVETGTAKTIHGMDGELFFGPSHSFAYDGESTGNLIEDELVVWGTEIIYDALSTGGPFTEGNYVRIGVLGAAGKIMYDNGTDTMIVALEDISITLVDGDAITEYLMGEGNGATGATADINVTVTNNDKEGGSGILLGLDDDGVTGNLFIQKVSGLAPVDDLEIHGITSDETCLVNGSVAVRTVPKVFLGSFVGSLIGPYGIGIDAGDLTSSDTVVDLDGDTNTPPNNVTFTVSGIISGDYVIAGPKAGGNDFNFAQMTLATTLAGAAETAVVITTPGEPDNTPSSGTLRITLDDGRHRLVAFSSMSDAYTFVIASTDFQDPDDATAGNDVMISYLDLVADDVSEAVTVVFDANDTWYWRVRNGGASPIKTSEGQAAFNSGGGGAVASRISDE